MATFPTGVAAKPANITDGLQILALHVSTAWDEILALESELLGSGAGAFIMDIRPSAAGNVILQSRQLAGDSQPRFQLTGSGDQRWGSGSAATDVTLSRSGTRTLTLTGSEVITPGNAADIGLTVKGAGSQTAALLEAQNSSATVFFRITAGGQVILSPAGTPTTAAFGIQFGNDSVANIYRSAGSTIKTDGNIVAAGNATVNNLIMAGAGAGIASTNTVVGNPLLRGLITGDTQDRLDVYHDGSMKWGPGGATATDTTLARSGVGILTLTGALTTTDTVTTPTITATSGGIGTLTISTAGTAPTLAVDTSTTGIATTAFVTNQASATTPTTVDDTAATVGTSKRYARADHRHALSSGIYDTTGNASRLNPMTVWTWSDAGFPLDSFTNGKEMRAIPGLGWDDQLNASTYEVFSAPRSSWANIGGTLQWRWQFWFSVGVAMTTCSFNLRYLNIAETGGVGTLNAVGGGAFSGLQATGGHYCDTGWQTMPSFSDGMIVPQIRFDKTGADTTIGRVTATIEIRNV